MVRTFWDRTRARVRGGLVVAAREYWTVLGGEEPPAWRKPYARRF